MFDVSTFRIAFTGKTSKPVKKPVDPRPLDQIPGKELDFNNRAQREEAKRRVDAYFDKHSYIVKQSPIPDIEKKWKDKRDPILEIIYKKTDPKADLWLIKILEKVRFNDSFYIKKDVISLLAEKTIPVSKNLLQEGYARTTAIVNAFVGEITKEKFILDKIIENQDIQKSLKGVMSVSSIFTNRDTLGKVIRDEKELQQIWPWNLKAPMKGWLYTKSQVILNYLNFVDNNHLVNASKKESVKSSFNNYYKAYKMVRENVLGHKTEELAEKSIKLLL